MTRSRPPASARSTAAIGRLGKSDGAGVLRGRRRATSRRKTNDDETKCANASRLRPALGSPHRGRDIQNRSSQYRDGDRQGIWFYRSMKYSQGSLFLESKIVQLLPRFLLANPCRRGHADRRPTCVGDCCSTVPAPRARGGRGTVRWQYELEHSMCWIA